MKRHIHHRLKNSKKINMEHIFIVHAGCSKDEVDLIVNEVKARTNTEHIFVNKTSATVACNCGHKAFGIIYLDK